MTKNRANGFPILKENSIFLQKILLNRNANSCDKRLEIYTSKPKKLVRFANPETISFKNIYQSPIRIRNKPNNSNENIYDERFQKKLYNKNESNLNSNNLRRINLYDKKTKIEDNKKRHINKPNYFRISINKPNKRSVSPDYWNNDSHIQSNSNVIDSDNKMHVLSFRGKKIFTSNSFYGLKNRSTSNSPVKIENIINSEKESELFRNPEELKKKKEEILLRKMKRESSALKRKMLKNEKDKDIKEQKININIITNNIKPNINKIRIIPLNKEINNNNRRNNNNKFRSNDNEQKKNSFDINIRSRNKKELNNSLKYNNNRRIYKFNHNTNNSNEKNSITKESQDPNSLNNSNNIILYPKKNNFRAKNIFISKFTGKTPPKNYNNNKINNKIKENLDFLRISKNSKNSDEEKEQTFKNKNKKCSPERIIKKKFIEDITYEAPTIYSEDKKVSIKVHILQNKNETFLGKKHTNQKLKMQRVINICFILNNKNRLKFLKNYKNINRKNDLRFLASIKEEEEKSKMETNNSILKTDPKIEIEIEKEKKPIVVEKNIRRKYLRRSNNKK